MFPHVLLLCLSAAPAQLHLVDASTCAPAPGLAEAFSVRLPGVALAVQGATARPGDRVVRLAGRQLVVEDEAGRRELERELPEACDALAEVAAAVVERHFSAVHWAGLGAEVAVPEVALPAVLPVVAPVSEAPATPVVSSATPPPSAEPASASWRLSALLGFGYGADGSMGRPRLGVEVMAGGERWSAGVLAGTSFEQRAPLALAGDDSAEVRSRVDDVLGTGALCLRTWRLRGCLGPAAGVVLLSGEAKGDGLDGDATTLVSFAAGGTALLTLDVTQRLFIAVRGVGVGAVVPLSLVGAPGHTLSFLVQGSLGVGWSFW